MNWQKHRLIVALVILAGLVAATFFVTRTASEPTEGPATPGTSALQAIDKDDVDELEIQRPNEAAVKLVRRAGTWRVAAPVDAAADGSAVDTALGKLEELEVQRIAATNPTNHARLEVDDAHGIRVIARRAGSTLVDLVIGSYGGGSTMVRKHGQNEVLAVKGSIKYAFNKALKDWRNRRVLDAEPTRVKELAFQVGASTWRFVRGEGDTWQQAAGEAPIERFSESKVQSIASSLARLRASDFAEADVTREAAGLADPAAPTVTLLVAPAPPASDGGTDGGADGGAAEPAAGPPERIVLRLGRAKEAEDGDHYLEREGDPTVYVVSRYLADKLRVTAESFQQPLPPADAGAPAAPEPAMPMDLGGGTSKLPPEVLEKIKAQLKQRGLGHP